MTKQDAKKIINRLVIHKQRIEARLNYKTDRFNLGYVEAIEIAINEIINLL